MKCACSIIAVFLFFIIPASLQGDSPAPVNLRTLQENGPAIDAFPVQGHVGPAVHSLDPGEHEDLEFWLKHFQEQHWLNWIQQSLERGRPYRHFIQTTIREYGLPVELEFLPIIESEFRSHAVSKSGAVGLWQFMTNSIHPYEMDIDEWMDERRDFWKATHGALAKLQYNYEELGDWLLALGAYNCGLGRMKRAIENSGCRDFWKLADGGYLPAQTAQYVPKVLAVSHVAGYAGRHGLPTSWEPGVLWARIELDQAVDLSILARESGTPKDLLMAGNSELRYGITPPGETSYFLKVPAEYTDVIKETLIRQEVQLMRFYLHRIQSGDTYYALSRHFGISVSMIERYNPGIDPRFLRIGATVVVPAVHDVGPFPRGSSSSIMTHFTFDGVYTVQPGDSLWSISRLYDISPEILARNNNLDLDSVLYAGTVLQVPEVGILREAGIVQ